MRRLARRPVGCWRGAQGAEANPLTPLVISEGDLLKKTMEDQRRNEMKRSERRQWDWRERRVKDADIGSMHGETTAGEKIVEWKGVESWSIILEEGCNFTPIWKKAAVRGISGIKNDWPDKLQRKGTLITSTSFVGNRTNRTRANAGVSTVTRQEKLSVYVGYRG